MASFLEYSICFLVLFHFAFSRDVFLISTPTNIEAQTEIPLGKSSDLLQLIESELGLSSRKCDWPGVSVVSPFGAAESLVIVSLHSSVGNVETSFDQIEKVSSHRFPMTRELDVSSVITSLEMDLLSKFGDEAGIQRQEQESLSVENLPTTTTALNASAFPDSFFLSEIQSLERIPDQLDSVITIMKGPQVLTSSIHSIALLEMTYGKASKQTEEAMTMVLGSLVQLDKELRQRKMGLIILTTDEEKSRSKRQANAGATEDDDTFTAVFNIMVWFTVVLVIALIYISVGIGSMDPGRDSIIYRMTSTRMKKDN